MTVKISDWVKGRTINGELFHGFVESVDDEQGMVKVYVVSSDNAHAVGKEVTVRGQWVRVLPESSLMDAGALHNLIDLALLTQDKEWFKELSGQYSTVRNLENRGGDIGVGNMFLKNRLRLSGRI